MATTKVITQIAGMVIGAAYDDGRHYLQDWYATKAEVAAAVSSAVKFQGSATYASLPSLTVTTVGDSTNADVGKLYNVSDAFGIVYTYDQTGHEITGAQIVAPSTSGATVYDAGTNVVWDGVKWDVYGSSNVDLTPYALDNSVVHLAGPETITGAKTFNGGLSVLDGLNITNSNSKKVTLGLDTLTANRTIKLPDKSGTLAIDTDLVHINGDESITDEKTFQGNVHLDASDLVLENASARIALYERDFSQIVTEQGDQGSISLQDVLDGKADAATNMTSGTYKSVTVNSQGIVTAGTNPTTISGYGITDAKIENGVITLGSNTITPLTSHQSLANYVTLDTNQAITGVKTFGNGLYASTIYIQQTYNNTEYGGWFGVITEVQAKRGLMYIYDGTNSRQFEFPNEGSTIQSIATKEWSNANVGVLDVNDNGSGTLTIAGNSTTDLTTQNSVTITYVTVTTA